jgi:DNA-binding NtrC family response regulator
MISTLKQDEAAMIRQALIDEKGNKTAAARRLGIPLRTLYRRLKTYHIEA